MLEVDVLDGDLLDVHLLDRSTVVVDCNASIAERLQPRWGFMEPLLKLAGFEYGRWEVAFLFHLISRLFHDTAAYSIVGMDRNRAAPIVILVVVLVEPNDCLAACFFVCIPFLCVLSERKITRSGYYLHMRRTTLFVLFRF